MNEDIKVTFVIRKGCQNENDCSEEMQLAFVTCEQHRGGGLQPRWVREDEIIEFHGLSKRDVFVLNEFAGEIYDKLRATKCLLVGPRCLSCCLTEGKPIPSGPEPVFTVAMRGVNVTASGLSKQQKETIKRKVHCMGGHYSSVLTDETTHLVSDTVLSDKYIKSIEKGIPVMSEEWVEAVYQDSLRMNVHGASAAYDKFVLPALYNLHVTTTGISRKEKLMVTKLVTDNGGHFSGAFQSEVTDIVILNRDAVSSEKYKAAVEYGKACVLPAWVSDSAARGAALPLARYRVAGAATSSPLAEHRLPDMSLNFSRITNVKTNNFVDETRSNDMSTLSNKLKASQEARRSSDEMDRLVQAAFDGFDLGLVKKAGPIFDGFCIYIAGAPAYRERAGAMVSRCGGVRYDAPHERVTHVLAGAGSHAPACAAARVVSPLWLIRSVEAGRALPEAEFQLDSRHMPPPRAPGVEPASPMSKRNLQLLRDRAPPPAPPPPAPAPEPEPADDIVNHYLSQNMEPAVPRERTPERASRRDVTDDVTDDVTAPPDVTEDMTEDKSDLEQIFRGVSLEVVGLDAEALRELAAEVAARGGAVLAEGSRGTHALLPLQCDLAARPGVEAVTVFWLKDCLSQEALVPIEYYHRPVDIPEWGAGGAGPLAGVVASLSTYSGVERAFLDELAKLLGATTQLRFCRRTTATARASTHLVCPRAEGDKYLGAVKWGLPAVTAGWLLACRAGRVCERPYLVGDTLAPSPQKQDEDSKSESNAEPTSREETTNRTLCADKENAAAAAAGDTPVLKRLAEGPADMSPASRYIAMARQGLLADTQDTPPRLAALRRDAPAAEAASTPPMEAALASPNLRAFSPASRRRLRAVRDGRLPSDPIRTPDDPFAETPAPTPDSAFGAVLRAGGRVSPESRRALWGAVRALPSLPPPRAARTQTPLSEIRNRFLAQFAGDAPTPPPADYHAAPRKLNLEDVDTPPSKVARMSVNQESPSAANDTRIEPNATARPEPADTSNPTSDPTSDTTAPPAGLRAVDAQLSRLSAALSGRASPRRRASHAPSPRQPAPAPESEPAPESQPNTVGWDDVTPRGDVTPDRVTPDRVTPRDITPPPPPVRRFMLSSNVDNREDLSALILSLGGAVSDGGELDPAATHLLCAAPGRSEKMLGSVAAGKWVLHPAYVARSRAEGRFVSEEEYEWGNPLATSLPALGAGERQLAAAAHRWRAARDRGAPGAFNGVRALLHVPAARRRLLARLLLAGGGEAPDLQPPYADDTITVCFLDARRYPLAAADAAWLRARRVPVCPPVLLSAYLTDDAPPDPRDHCLPEFRS